LYHDARIHERLVCVITLLLIGLHCDSLLWDCGKHGCIDTRAHGSECLCFGMDVHKHVSDALCNFNCYAKLEGLNLVAPEAVLLNITLILMISLTL